MSYDNQSRFKHLYKLMATQTKYEDKTKLSWWWRWSTISTAMYMYIHALQMRDE